MLERLSGLVVRRRRLVLVAAVLLALVGAAAGATLFAKLTAGGFQDLRAESGRAAETLVGVFGQGQPNLTLLVTAPGGVDDPAVAAAAAALSRRLAAEPGVIQATSYWTSGRPRSCAAPTAGRVCCWQRSPGTRPRWANASPSCRPATRAPATASRSRWVAPGCFGHELSEQAGRDVVTGELLVFPVTLVVLLVVFGSVVAALPLVVALVTTLLGVGLLWVLAGVTEVMVVLLFLLTGSVLLPLLALVLSGLSLTAAFGALVWVFQDGHLAWPVGDFTVTGTTISTVPVMLFAVAFGLAMDYQVFMLSGIREEYERRSDGTAAVATGLERISRIVTAAAVLISIVFLAFLVSDITLMKAFGVGLPSAVLPDATLIRGALLPATMRLGGRATWWAPGPLQRLHARSGLRERAEHTQAPGSMSGPDTPIPPARSPQGLLIGVALPGLAAHNYSRDRSQEASPGPTTPGSRSPTIQGTFATATEVRM